MCKILRAHARTRTHTHTHTHTQVAVLNGFRSLGQPVWSEVRQVIQKLLSKDEESVIGTDRGV